MLIASRAVELKKRERETLVGPSFATKAGGVWLQTQS